MLLRLLSHVWNSWMHRRSLRRSLIIKANTWKHCALLALSPWCMASCHSQLLVMKLCLCHSTSSFTHLWIWCMTGRGWCRPDEAEEGTMAKKWITPWSALSSLLSRHSPWYLRDARRCLKLGSVYRKEVEGQELRLRKHGKFHRLQECAHIFSRRYCWWNIYLKHGMNKLDREYTHYIIMKYMNHFPIYTYCSF